MTAGFRFSVSDGSSSKGHLLHFTPSDLVQVATDVTVWEIMRQFYATICSPQFVAVQQGCQ